MLLVGLGAIFDGISLLLLVPVLDVVTGPRSGAGLGGRISGPVLHLLRGYGQTERLLILLGAFVLLMAARGFVLSRRDRSIDRLNLEFVESIRIRLMAALATAGWRTVARITHARIIQALSIEIHQVGVAASSAVLATVALAMVVGHCVLAMIIAPLAAPAIIAFAALGAVVGQAALIRALPLGRAIIEAHFDMTKSAMSFLGGLKLATAQGLQTDFVREYEAAASMAMRDRLRFSVLQSRLRNVTTILAGIVAAATVAVGVAVFHLAPPVLITLLLILSRMSGPALALQQGLQQVAHSLPSFGVIRALEAELAEEAADGALTPSLVGEATGDAIVFSRVTFRHSADRRAEFEDVSLVIPAGAFVGITGPSGTGKTTFLDLVAGLVAPQSGRISVHGRQLTGADLDGHRRRLAYVAQDAFLFDGSVRRNLAWSQADCSEAEMLEALELVGAGELLRRLEDGLDTRIGERGVLISAGERQRLALARALLRRPALLALDEATNAIDVAGERLILERLARLEPCTTILMVAHRAESLALCDHFLEFPGATLTSRAVRTSSSRRR